MQGDYDKQIEDASQMLADAIAAGESDLKSRARELDGDVMGLLRRLGVRVMERLFGFLSEQVTREAETTGIGVQRRSRITYSVVFGPVHVESPYLWDRATRRSARPVKTELGLTHCGRSMAVQRALTDFGAEESFQQASKRFEEHYGWSVGRTTVLREVEQHAKRAQRYVEERLSESRAAYDEPEGKRPGVDRMLVELDGSELRTGTLAKSDEGGKTPVRKLPRRKREEAWREVRVGFARNLDEVERTYVAKMASYPEVVGQLFSAAVDRGLSSRTQVYAAGDGGNGLREEIETQFCGVQFILDRPHLKSHFYEAAEAIGLQEEARHRWVRCHMKRIDAGKAGEVLKHLKQHKGRGKKRVTQLAAYLKRFQDAVHYEAFLEAGAPMGSGEVESAHRYIPQKRLKISGACWHPDTINPMLALRTMRANDWWDDYWTHVTEQRRAA